MSASLFWSIFGRLFLFCKDRCLLRSVNERAVRFPQNYCSVYIKDWVLPLSYRRQESERCFTVKGTTVYFGYSLALRVWFSIQFFTQPIGLFTSLSEHILHENGEQLWNTRENQQTTTHFSARTEHWLIATALVMHELEAKSFLNIEKLYYNWELRSWASTKRIGCTHNCNLK